MMDLPGDPLHLLEEDLENLRTFNRYLGAYRGLLRCLQRKVKEDGSGGFSLLDVGTGSGDIPVAIARWARHRGLGVRIVGLELHPVIAGIAHRRTRGFPEISIVRGDGIWPPIAPGSFDFVLFSQVLHHFSEEEILVLLKTGARLARRAVLVSDLLRHRAVYYGIRLLTRLFTRNDMTRTDAPLSVRRAFTLAEWKDLFERAGLGRCTLYPCFPFRLLALSPVVDNR